MPKFSDAQTARISEVATKIAHQSDVIKRLEGECTVAKDNLKLAKTEMGLLQIELKDATESALSGKEPLPYLFAQRNARES